MNESQTNGTYYSTTEVNMPVFASLRDLLLIII